MSRKAPKVQNAAFGVAEYINLANTQKLRSSVHQAANVLSSKNSTTGDKVQAINMLGLRPNRLPMGTFKQLLTPRQPAAVQKAAAKVLVEDGSPQSTQLLLARWNSYNSNVRNIVENSFLSDQRRTLSLMKAIKKGEVKPTWVSLRAKQKLLRNPDKKVQKMAKATFGELSNEKRDKVLQDYFKHVITLDGNASRGVAVFAKTCAVCHQLGGLGHAVGPDLLSVTGHSTISLLRSIIEPSRAIVGGFEGYIVQTKDNHTFTGVISHKTPSKVTIRSPGGGEKTISRDNIKSLHPMSSSLMPTGLEKSISYQQMADLIKYLQNAGK
jgi:putative heme-binding domain-containing protein